MTQLNELKFLKNDDILRVIDIIEAKIIAFQKARECLVNAFINYPPKGRKLELAKFLTIHGSSSRIDIINNSGLPYGTISYCLTDKRFFRQGENGNWQFIGEY